MATDPLAELVVDEAAIARGELAEVLEAFVRLTKGGDLIFEPAFDSLTAHQRVCCVLLSLRAGEMLGFRAGPGATPKEIVELSGMPAGTVRPKLVDLTKRRLARKANGRYEIPVATLRAASRFVRGASNE